MMDLQGTGSPQIEVPASEHSSTVKTLGVAALASLLYLLLADVAIETFWSGAPVRWWVLGVVTIYLVGLLVAWRSAPTVWKRMTPAVLATSGAGVFLVLLAATLWLPGGLDNGMRLVGQPTSVVLTLLTTCAVILAGAVVLRLRAVPLWARLALTALAAYACAGFVMGLLRSTPYHALFHGLGFWSRLPVWLQGPRLGAFVVLPLGAIALALTWLKHRGDARMSTSRMQPGMLLLAAFAASLAAVSAADGANPLNVAHGTVDASRSSLPAGPLSPEQKQQAYETEVSALRDRVARLQTFVDSFPKALVEVDALSGTLAAPEAAFAFVRDQIALEPYSGVMKGAAGTLVTRGGNALDRALLLARILGRNGIATRIARGRLPAPQAPILLQQIASSSDAVGLIARSLGDARPASRLSDRDRQSADSLRLQAEGRAKTARAAADQGYGALKASLEKAGLPIGRDTGPDQLKILQDHFWVKATIAGQTIDLDPSVADARMTQASVEAIDTYDPDRLPETLYQHLTIRVMAEFLDGGRVSSTELLARTLRSVDLVDRNIRLAVEPQAIKPDQNDYQVTLAIGDTKPAGQAFQIRPTRGAARPQDAGPGVSSGLFGGLGGGAKTDEAPPKQAATPAGAALGRLFVEMVSSAPQMGDAQYRRVIVDRLEPDRGTLRLQAGMENDNAIRTLLPQVWDGAISIGPSHPLRLFMMELEEQKAHEAMEEKARAAKYRGQAFSADDLAGPRLPPELVNYFFYSSLAHHFVAAKEAPGVRQFNLRPRLAFFRHGFAVHDWSKPNVSRRYQEGLDVVSVPYGFVGPREASATLGLKIGVADTSLERSFAGSGTDFNTVPLVASAGNQKIALTTAGPGQASTIDALPLPVAIKAVLRDELAEGRTLVLPASLVTLNQVRTYGWWSIDPESGVALGKMDLGAGQGMVEYSKLSEKMLEMSHIFAKFYGGVLGCFMMEIADQLVPPNGPYKVLDAPGLPKIEGGKDLGSCIASKACEAIVELTILAASSAAYHEEAEEMIKQLVDLVLKTWIAEEGAGLGCAGLEGGEH